MSVFGADECLRYSQHVRPVMLDGVRCVVLEGALAGLDARVYRFMLDFARDNELKVHDPANPGLEGAFCELPLPAQTRPGR